MSLLGFRSWTIFLPHPRSHWPIVVRVRKIESDCSYFLFRMSATDEHGEERRRLWFHRNSGKESTWNCSETAGGPYVSLRLSSQQIHLRQWRLWLGVCWENPWAKDWEVSGHIVVQGSRCLRAFYRCFAAVEPIFVRDVDGPESYCKYVTCFILVWSLTSFNLLFNSALFCSVSWFVLRSWGDAVCLWLIMWRADLDVVVTSLFININNDDDIWLSILKS